jgi:hypothetical protein
VSAAATALEAIRGAKWARELLDEFRTGTAAPDALLDAIGALQVPRSCESPSLRAFARELQKALELSAPAYGSAISAAAARPESTQTGVRN